VTQRTRLVKNVHSFEPLRHGRWNNLLPVWARDALTSLLSTAPRYDRRHQRNACTHLAYTIRPGLMQQDRHAHILRKRSYVHLLHHRRQAEVWKEMWYSPTSGGGKWHQNRPPSRIPLYQCNFQFVAFEGNFHQLLDDGLLFLKISSCSLGQVCSLSEERVSPIFRVQDSKIKQSALMPWLTKIYQFLRISKVKCKKRKWI
jgi:hypothetical protein